MSSELLMQAVLVVVLVAVNAFLAAAEIALVSVRRPRLQQLEDKDPDAASALRLLGDMGRFLATIQVGITVVGFLASAVGAVSFVIVLSNLLARVPLLLVQQLQEPIAIVLVTVFISFVFIIFGELVPKRLGIVYAESITLGLARPIEWLARATSPIVALLTGSANIVLTIFGQGKALSEVRPQVTEVDLRLLFDVAATEGEVEEREAKMLHRVFEFTDKLAREVMTPRLDILWLDKDATLKDFLEAFAKSYHARYPLCDDNADNILGIIYIKDILPAMASEDATASLALAPFQRQVYFVPETKRVGELFEEMRSLGHPMAIIVDEYGGTAGLVTLKQLLEEIVGSVGDEVPRQEPEYETIDEYNYLVDGSMRVDEMNEALHLDLPEGDYETVAGFILEHLGHIPRPGEQVRYNELRLLVSTMDRVKIEKVRVTRTPS